MTPHGGTTVATEHGRDFITTLSLDCVWLWGAFGNLEAVFWEDAVGGVGATSNLTAVVAMAKDVTLTVASHLVTNVTTEASSYGHFARLGWDNVEKERLGDGTKRWDLRSFGVRKDLSLQVVPVGWFLYLRNYPAALAAKFSSPLRL